MGRRVGQLAGLLGFTIMMGRLGRLFTVEPDQPPWVLILFAATLLGGIAWWLLRQVTNRRMLRVTVFAFGALLLAFRIMTPETLLFGVIPTGDSLSVIADRLQVAFRIIQSGVPPVTPNVGLLSILAIVTWVIGALFVWGSTEGPYAAMFLAPMVMYFQFAVFDRRDAGLVWMTMSGTVLAMGAVSMALERRGETGRARDESGRPMARKSLSLAIITAGLLSVGAIAMASNASSWVSEYGNAPWRTGGTGFGLGAGTGSFDGVIDLRQQVTNLSDEPVFTARFSSGAPPLNRIYFRMGTLDEFDLDTWDRSDSSYVPFQRGSALARESDTYQGTTFEFNASVLIDSLDSPLSLAPTPGVPVDIGNPPTGGQGRSPSDFNVLTDAAIFTDPDLEPNDTYQVTAVYPDLVSDLGLLATGPDGQLTPMFADAAASGEFEYTPSAPVSQAIPPVDLDTFVEVPEGLPSGIGELARDETAGAASDFEAGYMLEAFFRRTGEFEYDTNVTTGHDSLVLDDWLNDSTSRNYRTGYCEQFAAAMAVMARTVNIPSRVIWGFTPGEVLEDDQGQYVVVKERNAHAWVELWIEPVGWVRFDPTPRRELDGYDLQPESITDAFDPADHIPDITTTGPSLGAPEEFTPPNLPEFAEQGGTTSPESGPIPWIIALVVLVLLLGSIPLVKRLRRRSRLQRIREGDVTAAWDEIVDRLEDLGDPMPSSLTPIEVARTRGPALMPLAASYAAAVYGGREGLARESDFFSAELWIDQSYDTPARTRGAMSVRSLVRR